MPPPSKVAFLGRPLGAAYALRSRETTLYFEGPAGAQCAIYTHDTSLIHPPQACTLPPLQQKAPKITLRFENGTLNSYSNVRKLTVLMPVKDPASLSIVYPNPVHPDLVAWWAVDGRMFFTNNDYLNVYELPPELFREPVRPRRRISSKSMPLR